MIKFDKTTCMVIVSTDKIKYETRVSNIIAFGCPWPYPSNQILNYYKYKLSQQNPLPVICIYKTVIVFACAHSEASGETVLMGCCV